MNACRRLSLAVTIPVVMTVLSPGTHAESIAATQPYAITIRNPGDRPRTVKVRSPFPVGLRAGDIEHPSGLSIAYDMIEDRCLAVADIELQAGEERTIRLAVRDVWAMSSNEVAAIAQQAETIHAALDWTSATEKSKRHLEAVNRILAIARDIVQSPPPNGRRIASYIARCERARLVVRDAHEVLRKMEDLAFRFDVPPESLVARPQPQVPLTAVERSALGTTQLQFRFRNTSPHMTREFGEATPLPHELGVDDIVSVNETVYVARQIGRQACIDLNLELGPSEEETVVVEIVDVWRANDLHIANLCRQLGSVRMEVKRSGMAKSAIANKLAELETALARATSAQPPPAGPDYVAFRRDQAARLNEIQGWIERVSLIPQPARGIGPTVPPPSNRTTWLIIYAIIVFIGAVTTAVLLQARRQTLRPTTGGEGVVSDRL